MGSGAFGQLTDSLVNRDVLDGFSPDGSLQPGSLERAFEKTRTAIERNDLLSALG
jgi:hypothetical protein